MLEKLIAFYSKNNRNQQFYEYGTVFLVINQLAIVSNLTAILDTHPIPIFDIALNSTLITFAVLPILAARELWKINKAARLFLPIAPGRASRRVRTDRIENALFMEFETANKLSSQKEIASHINQKIDRLIKKYTANSFLYMIPFFIITLAWPIVILNYHDSVFELLQKEATGSWAKRTEISEIHSSKTNLMTNLIWATIALQIASVLAVKAAYSDLRDAVEGWLTSEPTESRSSAASPALPPLAPPA